MTESMIEAMTGAVMGCDRAMTESMIEDVTGAVTGHDRDHDRLRQGLGQKILQGL